MEMETEIWDKLKQNTPQQQQKNVNKKQNKSKSLNKNAYDVCKIVRICTHKKKVFFLPLNSI